jgi:hypothetical protein
MSEPLPLPELLDEWHHWAEWVSSEPRDEEQAKNLIGWGEFDWAVSDYPELAWQAILEAMEQPRMAAHLEKLAAGPLEDLLSKHGAAFIERVELRAKSSAKFAWLLGGVWQHTMPESIWFRVQAVWDRRGWDGNPTVAANPSFKRTPDGAA